MSDHRFPKTLRLLRPSDFDRVFQTSHFVCDQILVVNGRANEQDLTRLGLVVSRKTGKAVVRNRWKRLIREAFRTQYDQLPPGLDLVVRPRKGAECNYLAVRRSLLKLSWRLARRCAVPIDPKNHDGEPGEPPRDEPT